MPPAHEEILKPRRPLSLTEGAPDASLTPDTAPLALVVDDEDDMRMLVQEFLLLAGFRVLCAHSVTSALGHLSNEDVVLLITDLSMPEGGGLALIRAALSATKGRAPRVGIIVMTGHLQTLQLEEFAGAASFTCLQKPFRSTQLVQACKELLIARVPDRTV